MNRIIDRRSLAFAAAFALAFLPGLSARAADDLAALAAKSATEPVAVWYDSSRQDQADEVIAAFNKKYPKAKVRQESIPGGNGMVSRLTQEAMAKGPSADLVSVGGGETARLLETDLIAARDWAGLGLDPKAVVSGKVVLTAVSIYCLVYNKTAVKSAPTGWNDLIDPKYKENVGTWIRAAAFAELAASWGEEKTTAFYTDLLKQQPLFFNSTAPLAQSVASGEVALGLGIYHTSLPPLSKGAPIGLVPLDPSPISSIYSFVLARAAAPATAALFIAWMATPEGNAIYEKITGRGSPLLGSTETAKFLGGRATTEWSIQQKARYAEIFEKYNRMVASAKVK